MARRGKGKAGRRSGSGSGEGRGVTIPGSGQEVRVGPSLQERMARGDTPALKKWPQLPGVQQQLEADRLSRLSKQFKAPLRSGLPETAAPINVDNPEVLVDGMQARRDKSMSDQEMMNLVEGRPSRHVPEFRVVKKPDVPLRYADSIMAVLTDPHDKQKKSYYSGLAKYELGFREHERDLLAGMRAARRYYVDPDAVIAATRLGLEHPEALDKLLWRCKLPFPTVWFEWNPRAVLMGSEQTPSDDCPAHTGALLRQMDDGQVRCTLMGADGGRSDGTTTACLEIMINVDVPYGSAQMDDTGISIDMPGEKLARLAGLSSSGMFATLLGSAHNSSRWEQGATPKEVERRRMALARITTHGHWTPAVYWQGRLLEQAETFPELRELLTETLTEFTGTLRTLLCFLLLLNGRDYVTSDVDPARAGQRMVRGRLRPYLQHHTMKLRLPRHTLLHQVVDEARKTRDPRRHRRHEVEAHWCVNKHGYSSPTCATRDHHDWVVDVIVPDTGEVRRRKCQRPGCKALTWRREAHARGDASIGFVTRDHSVEV